MTFTEIVNEVKSSLSRTSPDATARIGSFVNARYRRITSSLGLNTSRRASVTAETTEGVPTLTFAIEKIESLYDITNRRELSEVSYNELRSQQVMVAAVGVPQVYAVVNMGAAGVTVTLYPTPAEVITLTADGLQNAVTLAGTDVPAFPADFHDILVLGASADEYRQMEKLTQSQMAETQTEIRLSELRYFIAKSSSLQNQQGGRRQQRWTWKPRVGPS